MNAINLICLYIAVFFYTATGVVDDRLVVDLVEAILTFFWSLGV